VTAGVRAKTIIDLVLVRLSTDVGGNQLSSHAAPFETTNNVFLDIGDVGVAAGEEIRSRLAKQVLHGASEEP